MSDLGRRMFFRGVVLHGKLSSRMWLQFLEETTAAMEMSAAGRAALWNYPLESGAGGCGQTIVQPITESFLALDTWPDHAGAYLFICSCKPISPDCLDDVCARFGLEAGGAIHDELELKRR